jgi:hypothetical protein
MSKRHPSELVVLDSIGRRRNRTPRTIRALPLRAVEDDRTLTGVRLANYGLSMVLLWAVVLAWAVSLVR